jgi:hypothetical protein
MQRIALPSAFALALAASLALPSAASASGTPGEDVLDVALPAVYIAGGAALLTLQAVDFADVSRFPTLLAPLEVFLYGVPLAVVGVVRLVDHDYGWGALALSSGLWFTAHAIYITARPEPPRTNVAVAVSREALFLSVNQRF